MVWLRETTPIVKLKYFISDNPKSLSISHLKHCMLIVEKIPLCKLHAMIQSCAKA